MMKRKIIDVYNIGSNKIGDLVDIINEHIKSGWEPYGEVFKCEDNLFTILLVRYEYEQ